MDCAETGNPTGDPKVSVGVMMLDKKIAYRRARQEYFGLFGVISMTYWRMFLRRRPPDTSKDSALNYKSDFDPRFGILQVLCEAAEVAKNQRQQAESIFAKLLWSVRFFSVRFEVVHLLEIFELKDHNVSTLQHTLEERLPKRELTNDHERALAGRAHLLVGEYEKAEMCFVGVNIPPPHEKLRLVELNVLLGQIECCLEEEEHLLEKEFYRLAIERLYTRFLQGLEKSSRSIADEAKSEKSLQYAQMYTWLVRLEQQFLARKILGAEKFPTIHKDIKLHQNKAAHYWSVARDKSRARLWQ